MDAVIWIVQKWNRSPSFHQKFLIATIYGFYAVLIFTVIILVTGKSSESKGESKIVIGSMSLRIIKQISRFRNLDFGY
jgi:hypothetical protein